MGKKIRKVIQAAPLVMIAVMAVIYLTCFRNMTVQQIIGFTPAEPFAAACVLLMMFALKSLSYFFPMALLFAASGILFPLYAAVPISLAGIAVMATFPFLIGRYAEGDAADALTQKYKKVSEIRAMGTAHQFGTSFFLRVISCLPYDIVSLTLGSMKYGYGKYLAGTILGTAPGAVLTTIMGDAVTKPLSPRFLVCAGANILLSVISAAVMFIRGKKKNERI